MAAMLVELTIEANEKSFVIVLQHGSNDITCKQSILALHKQQQQTKTNLDNPAHSPGFTRVSFLLRLF